MSTQRATALPALDPATATVAVVMPVRNEAAFIERSLGSVLDQTFDPERMEILVVDGESDDATASIAQRCLIAGSGSDEGSQLRGRVLPNPSRTIPPALNAGIHATDADVVIRVDGHCRLEPNYVETCVRLLAETGAANVGGLMRPQGQGAVGEAMALALSSRFGIGDSRFHYAESQEPAETVYLGAFRRDALLAVGGYDESLLANEDFELNHRLRATGYEIILSPAIRSAYVPRDTISGIARQFYRYGLYKALVMRDHPESIRPRHLIPPALVTILSVGAAFALTGRKWVRWPALIYGSGVALAAWRTATPKRLARPLLAVFPAMHLSWGFGVLVGLVRSLRVQR